jgi:regulator of sigma E protease
MNFIIAISIFSLIIVIHELGHFILAKKSGIMVTEFAIGMGPKIITMIKTSNRYHFKLFLTNKKLNKLESWKDKTLYTIKLIPIGGACIMLGEDDIAEGENAFYKKGVWERIAVIFAGPFFNFIFAFLLAVIVIAMNGFDTGYAQATVKTVINHSPVKEIGDLKVGDIITSINGAKIHSGYEFQNYFYKNPLTGEDIQLTYRRKGEKEKSFTYQPQKPYVLGFRYESVVDGSGVVIDALGKDMPMYHAGFKVGDIILDMDGHRISNDLEMRAYFNEYPLSSHYVIILFKRDGKIMRPVKIKPVLSNSYELGFYIHKDIEKINPIDLISCSFLQVKYMITTTLRALGQLVFGNLALNDLTGPVGVVSMIGDVYKANKDDGIHYLFVSMANMSILLSANLGIMNLLPFPALDGGRLVFLFIEALRKKPINHEKEGVIHMIGLAMLMLLMVIVAVHDITRLL